MSGLCQKFPISYYRTIMNRAAVASCVPVLIRLLLIPFFGDFPLQLLYFGINRDFGNLIDTFVQRHIQTILGSHIG